MFSSRAPAPARMLMHTLVRVPVAVPTGRACVGDSGRHGLYAFSAHSVMGAIIPALMHRIPSELRSQACLGESSTKMGDLLGSPRVAPLFLSFQSVNPLFAAAEPGQEGRGARVK